MDYLTRRHCIRIYGSCTWRSIDSTFPRLSSAGPRIIYDREQKRLVVPRREVEQAFTDLGLAEIIGGLPDGNTLDAKAIEEFLIQKGLDADWLSAKSDAFMNSSARPAREHRIRADARFLFADDAGISVWLNTPEPALGGRKPSELLETDVGMVELEEFMRGLLRPDENTNV